MSELETPTSEQPAPKPANPLWDVFSQANITTGLAVLAVVLAAAPYVAPRVSTYLVEKGLMGNVGMLRTASNQLRANDAAQATQLAQQQIKAHHNAIFNDPADPVIGNGPIKVVEFLDYQCAYCRAATPQVKQFLAANPDVQLVVKEYPVIHPQNSIALAAYGIEAYKAGKYEQVHYGFLMHNFHPENPDVKVEGDVNTIIAGAGLDPAVLKAHLNDQDLKDQINRTVDLGSDLGLDGTPAFIVGDTLINGINMAGVQAAVDAQRAAAKGK